MVRSETESGGLLKTKKRSAKPGKQTQVKRVRFSETNDHQQKKEKIKNKDVDIVHGYDDYQEEKTKKQKQKKMSAKKVIGTSNGIGKMSAKKDISTSSGIGNDSFKKKGPKAVGIVNMKKKFEKVDNKTGKKEKFLTPKEKRELKKKRRMKENKYFEIAETAKKIWEDMRRSDCPKEKRFELIEDLLKKIDGKVKEIIRAHDTVRVIQCIVAYGTPEQRSTLFQALKDHIVDLSKTKYAKFFVLKMLDYGSQQEKDHIIRSFHGKVKQLLRNVFASQVLEHAYNEVANAKQRGLLVQEYYGAEFALFKDETKLTLAQVLNGVSGEQKKKILSQMKEELVHLIDKGSIKHSITHHLLREYFTFAEPEMKTEMIVLLKELVVEILHTKDGSKVACQCLWFSSAKERKFIVKSFRKFVPKIACEEQGHFVLLAAFDVVDDTKLVEKVILHELFSAENVPSLIKDKHAVKIYEYLVSPRDPKFFHKDYVAKISPGDGNPHSKKEQSVRSKELQEAASSHLLDMVKNFPDELLSEGMSSLLLLNIMSNIKNGDRAAAINSIISSITKAGPYVPSTEPETMHIIEKAHTHHVIKKLLAMKKEAVDTQSFAKQLASTLDKSLVESYIKCNRGCFLLLSLYENLQDDSIRKNLEKLLQKTKKQLKDLDFKGAKILLEKLA